MYILMYTQSPKGENILVTGVKINIWIKHASLKNSLLRIDFSEETINERKENFKLQFEIQLGTYFINHMNTHTHTHTHTHIYIYMVIQTQ